MTDNRTPNERETVVVERGGGSGAGILIGVALLILVAIGAYFVINQNRNEAVKTEAVTEAARSVGDAADKAGDAIQGGAEKK